MIPVQTTFGNCKEMADRDLLKISGKKVKVAVGSQDLMRPLLCRLKSVAHLGGVPHFKNPHSTTFTHARAEKIYSGQVPKAPSPQL